VFKAVLFGTPGLEEEAEGTVGRAGAGLYTCAAYLVLFLLAWLALWALASFWLRLKRAG
jgi:hypothetical protein